MTKKNITITALAAALVLTMAAMSFAGPGYGRGGCGGPGNGPNSAYTQLSPEKQAAVEKIYEKYDGQFTELRNEMWTKHATLQAMVNGGNADEKKIAKLTGELTDLRDKMWNLRTKMGEELTKETGLDFNARGRGYNRGGGCPNFQGQGGDCYGQGYGRGMGRGMGPGMGHGMNW